MGGILSIGAGVFQIPLIEKAREHGLVVIACDGEPDAPGFAGADYARVVDIRDAAACLAIAEEFKVSAVSCLASEAGAVSAAKVADVRGLPGLPLAAALKATDKLAMRRAFEAAGLPSTRYFGCRSLDEAAAAMAKIDAPVVVKPSDGAGSRGVSYVGRPDALTAAFELAQANARSGLVMVEAYMPGRELAVEGIMVGEDFHTLCVSEKTRTEPPYLLDLRIEYPAPRQKAALDEVANLASAAARAIGVRDAPVHVEIIMTDTGPRLVEIAARGAGFHVFSEIVPWVTGIDTVEAQIRLALGEKPDLAANTARFALLDFPQVPAGRLLRFDGWDEVCANPDVIFCEKFKSVGQEISPLRSGADRVCAIAVGGETADLAKTALSGVFNRLRIETTGN
jgi:biotin carboxylase